MLRLFVAVRIPEHVQSELAGLCGGIPNARWEPPEKLHLTLRFVGEVDSATHTTVRDALERVRAPAPTVCLAAVGCFPPRGAPQSVWVGVEDAAALVELQARIERALVRAALAPERRKFAPHVTLARLRGAPRERVAAFLAFHSLYRAPPFVAARFDLMSSVRGGGGSKYRVESSYPLIGAPP